MYGSAVDHREIPVMTVDYAHRVMQTHLECLLSVCPIKRQAKARLIEAGHLVPADDPHIGF
jgi:hypothetical protein